jgi:phenylalanyl-tRNA synthetase beta chain
MKISYNWLQTYFNMPLPSVEKLSEGITMHAFEIDETINLGDDTVLDVKVLPNRAHDCLSHYGIAKEISTIFDIPLSKVPFGIMQTLEPESKKHSVTISTSKVKRFVTAYIEDVVVGPSPTWLKNRLEALGQKSINNIVDVTNFVMFDMGQPMHAFSASQFQLHDNGVKIDVRESKEGESTKTLDGAGREIPVGSILITDGNTGGNTILGIAGIKGGAHAEITLETKDIILEAACFDAETIRRSSKLLKLRTDASARFENAISPELAGFAIATAVKLILEIASGPTTKIEGYNDNYKIKQVSPEVDVTLAEINRILGTSLEADGVGLIVKRLNLPFAQDGEMFKVIPPFERLDITIKEDVIEEIGRIYGLEHIPTIFPEHFYAKPVVNKNFYYSFKIREILTRVGFSEVYTYAMQNIGEVLIENPLASDKKFLRHTLAQGLSKSLELNCHNAPLFGLDDIKIFEIGKVFEGGKESLSLGVAIGAIKTKKTKVTELLENIRSVLADTLGTQIESVIVEDKIFLVDLDALITKLPLPATYNNYVQPPQIRYKTPSAYPLMLRDIALFVPETVTSDEVATCIQGAAGKLFNRLDLFDVFKKEGKTSYAFRIVFQSAEKTLSDDEVGVIMEKVTVALNQKEDWVVR